MTDYTPTTEEVREQYWAASGDSRRGSEAWEEFDRWLNAQLADAWDAGYEDGEGDEAHYARGLSTDPGADEVPHSNPYREANE